MSGQQKSFSEIQGGHFYRQHAPYHRCTDPYHHRAEEDDDFSMLEGDVEVADCEVAEEAERVSFSWNFIWKVFLATLIISLILALLSYILAALAMPMMSDEVRKNMTMRWKL